MKYNKVLIQWFTQDWPRVRDQRLSPELRFTSSSCEWRYHRGYHVDSHCLENSPGTDTPTEDKQLLSTEGREQGQATPVTSSHANSSQDLHNDCKGPWPGYPECADKMKVTKPLL